MKLVILLSIAALGLTACGQSFDAKQAPIYPIVFAQFSANQIQCPNSSQNGLSYGTVVASGQDLNFDGVLEQNEIQNETVVCNGSNGQNGLNGSNGSNGQNGSSCSVSTLQAGSIAPNGGALISCTDGTSSVVLNGSNGVNGTNGKNGQDGTVVATVQFCPNVKPSYPQTFPEYGIVIAGVMYGVYSANGGFLAELPPGQYTSDGINASCTFTINSDGSISY